MAEFIAPPDGGGHPLVVVVHGGFWRAEYDRGHTAPQCVALATAGYVAAALEYQRVGADRGWPTTFADIAAGVDAVPGLLGDLVDPGRVVLIGHSAGGHLALWAAGRHRLPTEAPGHRPTPAPVRGVVALGAVADLGWARQRHLGGGAIDALLGPDAGPIEYAAADPARLLPTGVPTILLHGELDDQVPPACAAAYAAAARAAGDPCRLRVLPGAGHFEFIDPTSFAWPAVLAATAELLSPPGTDIIIN